LIEVSHEASRSARINSQWHFEHLGARDLYRRQGANINAQENTRKSLMTEQVNPPAC
jgi:hypothetical protein